MRLCTSVVHINETIKIYDIQHMIHVFGGTENVERLTFMTQR